MLPFTGYSQKKSLIYTTLIQMSLRIALVITIVTVFCYGHFISTLKLLTVEQLEKYIVERGQRESQLFQLAQDNHTVLKQELLARLNEFGDHAPETLFNQRFIRSAEGVIRNHPENFDGTKQAGVYIGKQLNITTEIRQRVLTFYDLVMSYGAAWHNRFQNTYITTPENIMVIYWPESPHWIQKASSNLNLPEWETLWVADPVHNPQRVSVWTGTYYDPVAKTWMVSCETPVDIRNQHIATIGHDVIIAELLQRTIHDALQGTYNLIFREDGRLIAHPQKMNDIERANGNFYIPQAHDPHLMKVFHEAKNLKDHSYVVENKEYGEYLAITKIKGPQWYLVSIYPQSLLSEKALKTTWLVLFLGILSLFAEITILFWVLKKKVARPLHQFIEATEQFALGHFNIQLPISEEEELNRLVQAFTTMGQEIQTREFNLQQTQKAIERSNQQLREEILERQFIETALQEAKHQLEIANRVKTTFLTNMNHELRTPLNGILGYAQVLQYDSDLNAEQEEGLDVIQRCGEHLLMLIDDILDISKLETNQIKLYPQNFDFSQFLEDIVDMFQIQAAQKKISFLFEPMSSLPTQVYGDEKRLRQILINLLSNAVKFTHQGGVVFKVTYELEKAYFEIQDTGMGITSEEMDIIFLPFRQAGDPKCRPQGTGIGLSIAMKLIEMMGGKLQGNSVIGCGSTFSTQINLPKSKETSPHSTPVIIGFEGPPRKILVADDKWENRLILKKFLHPLGFEIIEASNGQECLEKTYQTFPDAIIVDLVMPIIDGFEVTRQLRKQLKFQDTVIIAISSSILTEKFKSLEKVGYSCFLAKPIRSQTLLELLQKYLNLVWVYQQTSFTMKEYNTFSVDFSEPLLGPSGTQAEMLFDLVTMGNLEDLLQAVEEFEKQNEQLTLFANKIRQLAKSYEIDKIEAFIKQYLIH